jgi:hypothetical protein
MSKLKSKLVKWLTGFDPETFKAHQTVLNASIRQSVSGMEENYLFDFKNWSSQYNGHGNNPTPILIGNPNETNSNVPTKIKVKPIDVLNELETVPNPFSLTLIDEKVEILKDKSKLIVQHYAKREVEALIERLENRKKYTEHKAFFDRYQNTTDEKMDVLLEKYDLVMKTSDIFVPEFPDDAIKAMKDYTEAMELVCGKKPIFYVIAEAKDFKKAYEKRDPILLVQSPFGFYWQILGAWDKEMLLLSEL